MDDKCRWEGRLEERKGERATAQGSSFCPVLLYVEVPLPREMVVLVVVSELGFDVVGAARQHALGGLLQRGQEVILSRSRAITSHHVVRLINYRTSRGEGRERERGRSHIRKRCSVFKDL